MTVAITWIDAAGGEHPLTPEEHHLVNQGMLGHRSPPIRLIEEEIPTGDGGIVRGVITGVREVSIPLLTWETETMVLDDRMAELASVLDPARGAGQLRVERDDGTFRLLTCLYSGGLEGTEELPGHEGAVLVFRAHDPYWQDLTDVEHVISQDLDVGTFFPFFPMVLLASELFADVEVDNAGDVVTWPVWRITGPGNDPVVRNLTTGRFLRLDADLGDADELIIDTRPAQKSVLLNGASIFASLSADSALFPLEPGTATVRVELSAATEATEVLLSYRQRYRGA